MSEQDGTDVGQIFQARRALSRCGFPDFPWTADSDAANVIRDGQGEELALIYHPAALAAVLAMPALVQSGLVALAQLRAFAAIASVVDAASAGPINASIRGMEDALGRVGIKHKDHQHG